MRRASGSSGDDGQVEVGQVEDALQTQPFGQLLRQYRLDAGLTQQVLAERAGLSMQAIGVLERGERRHPYRATVDLLADALGLSDEQRRTFLAAARRPSRPILATGRAWPSALPRPPTPLVGREREIDTACELLARPSVRLVTLTGTPGVGKTRLGLAVAARIADSRPDGVFFVPLAPIVHHGLVGGAIRRALGLHESQSQSLEEVLVSSIGDREVLLLLDNFEHVLPSRALLAELVLRCPNASLLVTSRTRLHLRGEHVLVVPPLSVPVADQPPTTIAEAASVALFINAASASVSGFGLTPDTAGTVARICQRLDGLPLALELAAARLRLLTPDLLLRRLGTRLQVLVDGASDLPDHQRTMRATLQWSYAMLSRDEQALFRRLAIFAGTASMEAVHAVCSGSNLAHADLTDLLAGLIDQSLIQRETGPDGPRFDMLETLREFGIELLTQTREMESAQAAYVAHYRRLAESAEPALKGPAQAEWLDRLEREHEDLRAVLRWALEAREIELGLEVAARIWIFWDRRGYWREGIRWLDDFLARAPAAGVSIETRARAMNAVGNLAWQGDFASAERRYQRSFALYQELGDENGMGRLLNNLGMVRHHRHDYRSAMELYEQSLALLRATGDHHSTGNCLDNMGLSACEMDELARADELLSAAIDYRQRVGDSLGLSRSLLNLSRVALGRGDAARAADLVERSIELSRRLGDEGTAALGQVRRGDVDRARGDYAAARDRYSGALATSVRLRAIRVAGVSLSALSALAAERGDWVEAARWSGAKWEASRMSVTQPEAAHLRVEAAVREALSEAQYLAASEHGRAGFAAELAQTPRAVAARPA